MKSEKVLNKIDELETLLLNAKISNNKEEKTFRYDVYDLYEEMIHLIKDEFASQNETDDYSIYFSLYVNELNALKDKLTECSKNCKTRASLSAFLVQLSIRVQAKIDVKGKEVTL